MLDKFKKEVNEVAQQLEILRTDGIDSRFNYTSHWLFSNEAMYVVDLRDRSISYERNMEAVLGYGPSEFTFDMAYSNIHPEDFPAVNKVLLALLNESKKYGVTAGTVIRITCRMRKKDGSYIKILRTSGACRLNPNKTMRKHFSILQDISFLDTSNAVKWSLDNPLNTTSDGLNEMKVMPAEIFTKREHEVYILLREGLDTKRIANKLGISHYTVSDYRKSLLKKTNARNTLEMLQILESGSLFKG